jgi:hypothetical protein
MIAPLSSSVLPNETERVHECFLGMLPKIRRQAVVAEKKRGLDKTASKRRSMERRLQHRKPPLYIAIKDDVLLLLKEDLEIGEMAERLKCDRNTLTKTMKYLRETCGLEISDGRTRRKSLTKNRRHHKRKPNPPEDGDKPAAA